MHHTPVSERRTLQTRKSRDSKEVLADAALPRRSGRTSPPAWIGTPKDIWERGEGKDRRSALHELVHSFRRAYGYIDQGPFHYTPRYRQAIKRHSRISLKSEQGEFIKIISSPDGYRVIRQAGRGRMSMPPLPPKVLKILCREIRAALVWSLKFRTIGRSP